VVPKVMIKSARLILRRCVVIDRELNIIDNGSILICWVVSYLKYCLSLPKYFKTLCHLTDRFLSQWSIYYSQFFVKSLHKNLENKIKTNL